MKRLLRKMIGATNVEWAKWIDGEIDYLKSNAFSERERRRVDTIDRLLNQLCKELGYEIQYEMVPTRGKEILVKKGKKK